METWNSIRNRARDGFRLLFLPLIRFCLSATARQDGKYQREQDDWTSWLRALYQDLDAGYSSSRSSCEFLMLNTAHEYMPRATQAYTKLACLYNAAGIRARVRLPSMLIVSSC